MPLTRAAAAPPPTSPGRIPRLVATSQVAERDLKILQPQIPGKREGPKSNWMYAILDTNVLSKGLFGTPIWPIPWTAKNLSMIVGFARRTRSLLAVREQAT